jgi:hypothetical protein
MKKRVLAYALVGMLALTGTLGQTQVFANSIDNTDTTEFIKRTSTIINADDLAVGDYMKSQTSYHLVGDMLFDYEIKWTPVEQQVMYGFMSTDTSLQNYWLLADGIGQSSGSVSTSGIPDGMYYIAIANYPFNTQTINVNAVFDLYNR